ncbi:MAG TPA: winged helix-turn-helix domain-containing protein [Candidatus Methanoperedens sp.]|nr:winged helix-turn-helix domain-containing protein [Candidatus Methanoperedens sp.]
MKTKLLDILTFSEKRENLLILLREGPKSLEEIRSSLNVTSSGMIPQIRKLEERNLVHRIGKNYELTDIGMIVTNAFFPLIKTMEFIEKHENFLKEHDIKAIPVHLLTRIFEFENSSLTESKISELYEPHKEFMKYLRDSRKFLGIALVFHHSYPPLFLKLAESGRQVSIILTKEVFEKVKKEYEVELSKFIGLENGQLFISNEIIRLASAVTDNFMSLSLFFKSGGYDSQRELVSSDKTAIKWGEELFYHFIAHSKKVKNLKAL